MKKVLALGVATTATLALFATSRVVSAAPPANSDNVRICHRTHSVTNPYVSITVDQRSLGNGNGKHGGGAHDAYATTLYASNPRLLSPSVPNVYDPSKTYPANDKKWGDIIAFTDVSGNALTGGAASVAGLNNFGIGASIFTGTGAYAGVCTTMNPRDYYEVEKQAGIDPTEILKEMDEFDAPEFASVLSACGGTFIGCDPLKFGSITLKNLSPAPATNNTLPAGTTLAAGKGALEVKIWVDSNRNGTKSSSEKTLKSVTVTISGPNGVTKTLKTDSNGYVLFLDLDPGSWSVKSILTTQSLEKVYDSDGAIDWKTNLVVTEGTVAAARFAAAPASTLPATGTPLSLWLALLGMGSLLAGLMFRQRRNA